jgi:hypothetical protein
MMQVTQETQMTPTQAKKIIAAALINLGLGASHKLTAKTISFSDLGRGSRIFVKIHDWQSHAGWSLLQDVARSNGFSIE